MQRETRPSTRLIGLVILLAMAASAGSISGAEPPRVFLMDGQRLLLSKQRVAAGDDPLVETVDALRAEADAAMEEGPFSVTDDDLLPPSGDKHDYMSVGPYWWPDPEKADGLPYIRHDGKVNPEYYEYDSARLSKMCRAVNTLALAYYMTGHEPYADHAASLLRTWFLDDATRMNPHLQFGQAIPGRCTGRCIGIIDTTRLPVLIDSVGLIETSDAWTDADQRGLVQWFDAYLAWILESKYGREEAATRNNHATWYDVQAASFALFVGKKEIALRVLEAAGERRFQAQIEPDGRQPHELARTKAFGYSTMNLRGFFHLAALGDRVDVDFWNYKTEDGSGSIRRALDWLVPYATGAEDFPFPQISSLDGSGLIPLLRRASIAYDAPAYEAAIRRIPAFEAEYGRQNLVCPIE